MTETKKSVNFRAASKSISELIREYGMDILPALRCLNYEMGGSWEDFETAVEQSDYWHLNKKES